MSKYLRLRDIIGMEISNFEVVSCFRRGKLFNLDRFDYNTASILGQESAGILPHKKDSGRAHTDMRLPYLIFVIHIFFTSNVFAIISKAKS